MGIKGLNSWITATFPGVMVDAPNNSSRGGGGGARRRPRKKTQQPYDHVLIDANGIVHQACRRSSTETQVFRDVVRRLDEVFRQYPPRISAFIALDGPGPNAKMFEQRKRRIDRVLKGKRDEEAKIVGSAEYERRKEQAEAVGQPWPPPQPKKKRRKGLDSLQVTPGTLFMLRLRRVLEWYAVQRLGGGDEQAASWTTTGRQSPLVFVSGADVAGEGEIKIIEHLHDARGWSADGDGQRFLLVGPDADLLLLGLAAGVPHCDVLTMDGNGNDKLFRVNALCKCLVSNFGGSVARGGSGAGLHELDFLAIAFLQGNDYLPKLPGANLPRYSWKLPKLLKEKRWRGQHLLNVRDGTIVEVNLPLLVALTKGSHARRGENGGTGEDKGELDEDQDMTDAVGDETSDTTEASQDDSSGIKKGSDPSQYLTCLAWCTAMYLTGTCPDYAVTYQYRKPPTAADLESFQNAKHPQSFYQIQLEGKVSPLPADIFSLCLLPGAAKQYVPLPLQCLMDKDGPLSDIFHQSNPSPHNLVPRIKEAVEAVDKTDWKEENLMAVAHGSISVYGSLKGNRPHPFLVASKKSLSPFRAVHPPPFGPPNNSKVDQRKIVSIGCTTIDPNTQGAPLQNWAWEKTNLSEEQKQTSCHCEGQPCKCFTNANSSDAQGENSSNNQSAAPSKRLRKARRKTPSNTPCHFFLSGTCKKGIECRFSHGDSAVLQSIDKCLSASR